MDATSTSVGDRLEIPRLTSYRRRFIALAIGALIVAGAAAAYFLSRGPERSPYRGAPVTRTTIVKEISVTGHLELVDEMEVPAPIEGQLVEVFVKEGDEVKQGQLLAQLDDGSAKLASDVAEAELQVASARASEAEAAMRQAEQSLGRTERLAEKGLTSARTLETARADTAKARAALQAARAERAAAKKRAALRGLERKQTGIVAPRDGLVLEVPKRTGMVVGPQTRLFRIGASIDQMDVQAPIGEADIGEVVVGQGAKFEVPTYPGRSFDATVKHISPDPQTEYGAIFYDVTLETSNPGRVLLPGMTAQVRIKVAEAQDVLAVREASLRFTPEGAPPAPARSRVWRVEATALQEIPVESGLSDGAMTEVRPVDPKGLKPNDQVAIGLAINGEQAGPAPSLSLRGHR